MTLSRVLAFSLAAQLAAACGPTIPAHSGYASKDKAPWTKPKRIILDENNEAEVDDEVSYPRRQRARWYLVDLPSDGSLRVAMTADPSSPPEHTDVGLEILDSGFNVLAGGPEDEGDEEPDLTRTRTAETRPGKHYVHVFTRGKIDEAAIELRVKYEARVVEDPKTNFPGNVPNPPLLASVPPADDAPLSKPKPRPDKPKPDKPKPEKIEGKVVAKITEFAEEGSGVRIVIDKGGDDGVDDSWAGYIVSKATKKKLGASDFKVKTVRPGECEAVVKVSVDEVQANRMVVLLKGSN